MRSQSYESTNLSRHLLKRGVQPEYLMCDRIEVGKAVHEFVVSRVFPWGKFTVELSTQGVLYVGVTAEFD